MGEETFCAHCDSNGCVRADGMTVTDTVGGGRGSVLVVDVLVEGTSFTGDFVASCEVGVGVVLEVTGSSVGGILSDGVSAGIWTGFSVGRVGLGSSAEDASIGTLTLVAR